MNPPAQPELPERGFAVVGLGKMGTMHAAMLTAQPDARLAALVDADAGLARQVQSMSGDGGSIRIFTDLEQCLTEAQPAGVVISTPQFTHRRLVEQCLERGVPVFCEKPMAHTLDDARAMRDASRKHPKVPLGFGFQMGHNPLYQRAVNLLREGALGEIKSYRASCRLSQVFSPKKGWTFTREKAGGGVLINSGCHLLHALALLFGRPTGAIARGSGVHNEVEDTFGAILDYAGGLWGLLEVTWSVPGHEMQTNDIEAIGTAGTLEINNDRMRIWLSREAAGLPAGWSQWRREELEPRAAFSLSPDYCGDEFYLQMADFVAAARGGRPPRIGADEAYRVQEMLDALYRSQESRQWVALAPPETGG